MVNELSSSQSLSSSSSVEPSISLGNPQAPINKEKVLQALKSDDWPTFKALTLGENAELNIATERFEDDMNCFHVAVTSGSHSIVSNLAKLNSEWVRDLVNETESRCSPLMYAADAQTDNPDLIDALIHVGATAGFAKALGLAARNGHPEIAKRLIANDVNGDAPHVLYSATKSYFGTGGTAAKLLISLGVNAVPALPEGALVKMDEDVIGRLLLLGTKGSDKLAEIAQYRDRDEVEGYIKVGADAPRALAILANKPPHELDTEAMTLVASTESTLKKKPELEIYESALLRLVRNKDTAGVQAFGAALNAINPAHLKNILNRLTAKGDSDTLIMLTANPEDKLVNAALAGNFAAIKALLSTDVHIPTVLQQLSKHPLARDVDVSKVLQLLILAGTDSSLLSDNAEQLAEIDQRNLAISQLSQAEKNTALIAAARQNKVVDVVLLIKGGADKLAALRRLGNAESIRTLLKADNYAGETVIDRLKANDMELVPTLLRAKDVSAEVLDHLIKTGDLQTASALISILENKNQLLLQAVQDGNEALGKLLLSNGAEGPRLLASLLHTGQRELAHRLSTWGVDVNTARMLLTEHRNHDGSPAKIDLVVLGSDLSIAVMRAFEANNIAAVKKLFDSPAWVGSRVILRIIDDKTITDDVKTARLKLILPWVVSTDEAMQTLAERNDTDNLQRLIRLGVPADAVIMDASKLGDIRRVAALIGAGADIGKPMQILQASNEQEALHTLTVALTVAQSNSILAHARANDLPYRINPSGSVELL